MVEPFNFFKWAVLILGGNVLAVFALGLVFRLHPKAVVAALAVGPIIIGLAGYLKLQNRFLRVIGLVLFTAGLCALCLAFAFPLLPPFQ